MTSPTERETALQSRDLPTIFKVWEDTHATPGFDPVPFLSRLSELFEEETETYMQKDLDPFDERHPSRLDPDCQLGRMLKLLFRKDNFMTRLVNDYLRDNFFTRQNIQQSSLELNIAACRLILVIMPGLETSAVFQLEFDNLITRLYAWAEDSPEPLQSYATGLLAAAMEVQDIAIGFRDQNAKLIPLMLKRLHQLQLRQPNEILITVIKEKEPDSDTEEIEEIEEIEETEQEQENNNSIEPAVTEDVPMEVASTSGQDEYKAETSLGSLDRPFAHLGGGSAPSSPEILIQTQLKNGLSKFKNTTNLTALFHNDGSQTQNTKDNNKYLKNMISIHPPTIATSEMLILRYLTPMGEYQEFLGHVFEQDAMLLIFRFMENLESKDTCLAFEAIKYLASLLCHKKFSLEFINNGGLERLLRVPKPSIASTGVSISLYYLAYCEDAMERICSMPKNLITDLVKYALWLLSCSHDSGRCHATMFFGLSFQFKIILDEFDLQDGIRMFYNVVSILPILSINDDDNMSLNDDEECAARQIVRHVCVALKKYMESHLYYKYTHLNRQNNPSTTPVQPTFRASRNTPETISDQVRTLQEMLPMRARWSPVEELLELGGITLLLRIIAFAYEWNYSGRAETVRSALDVISICCVVPKVHHVLCELITLPDEAAAAGVNIMLGAAEGEIVADPEVQKSALAALVHCVCAPINRPSGSVGRFGSAKKKTTNKSSEELILKVWESVRSNNGIIVLLQLMQTKIPITDADCIRGMACRSLAGLARSETVRQIMSKLPLFTNGQLQGLMRDPILQEKRAEHVQFQKYALELMERVSGKSKSSNNEIDTSLANIHKANVVAQTKISFNENQLNKLIHQHLIERGLNETANALKKETGLNTLPLIRPVLHHSPFSYKNLQTTSIHGRSRIRSKTTDLNTSLNVAADTTLPNGSGLNTSMEDLASLTTPIKLIKKIIPQQAGTPLQSTPQTINQQRSLQKQIFSTGTPSSVQKLIETSNCPKNITLDTIITEYLTNQHALCKNPMSTCPQFDLFAPHKCPDPRPNKCYGLSTNFSARFFKRQAGFNARRLDRLLVHSQFCVARTLRPQDTEIYITCCDFTPDASKIICGSYSGEVKVFNINESNEEFSNNCHDSYINCVKSSRDGTLLLTSCTWRSPYTILWNIENKNFSIKLQFEDEEYCEFSNLTQDKVLGTKSEISDIYDISTGQKISTFVPKIFNQYTKNRATFNPTDDLILSDGVLWDVKSGREIHKFDKLNQTISGVFHPNGLEIVSNTEVWDLRSFHLLRTVPSLDQCNVAFSPQNVIYGICPEIDSRIDLDGYTYESSFKTLDSYDYTSIATVDVKRSIYDLSVNKYGSQIALVENQGGYDSVQESVVRVYSVGRKKNMEDEAEEDDDDMVGSDDTMSESSMVFGPSRDNIGNGPRRLRDRPGGAVVNGSSSDLSSDISFEGFDVNNENDSDDDDDIDDDDMDLDDDAGGSDWTSASDLEGGEWFDV